jgi:pSer/pThr/pTyr-binding forkhead associated (FHA) protein
VEISLGDRFFEITPGAYVIGREAQCQFPIDNAGVSRRHALLTISEDSVTIEDLGSRNGVEVEGGKVVGRLELNNGDFFRIGGQEFRLRVTQGAPTGGGAKITPERKGGVDEPVSGRPRFLIDTAVTDLTTPESRRVDLGEALKLSAQALAAGDVPKAERVVFEPFFQLLERVRAGQPADGRLIKQTAAHVLRLAQATRKAIWIGHLFELYSLIEVLMARDVVDALHQLAPEMRSVPAGPVREYVDRMSACESDMDGLERALFKRIVALQELVGR